MSIQEEFREALGAKDIQKIIASSGSSIDANDVERELLRRKQEITLELSKVDQEIEEAEDRLFSVQRAVFSKTDDHGYLIGLGVAIITCIVMLLLVAGAWGLNWSFGREILATWRAPFWSGWVAAGFWGLAYASIAGIIFYTDFFSRRKPRRQKAVEQEEGLETANAVLKNAIEARRRRLHTVLRDYVTEIANRSLSPWFHDSIVVDTDPASGVSPTRVTLATGLAELATEGNEIPTAAREKLLRLFHSMPAGSIGISGPRGVGKTTLMASVCGPNLKIGGNVSLALLTAAPVEYDARDFLLHLFSSLCRRVLQKERVGQDRFYEDDVLATTQLWQRRSIASSLRPAGRILLLTCLLFLSIAFAIGFAADLSLATNTSGKATAGSAPIGLGLQPGPFAMLAVVLGVLGVVCSLPRSLERILFGTRRVTYSAISLGIEDSPERHELVRQAADELRHIRFQRTYTSGWSGALKIPVAADFSSTRGLNLSQQSESFPELVERFRRFASSVAASYGHLIIGIDELDKLKSAQEAEGFLNNVKSVFGIENCFYLISVSEHALSSFERRGLGFRDAFDSALDDIVHVRFLGIEQSRLLLNRRILRFPDPFAQLCHMLSGGLPRDLIRAARLVIEVADSRPNKSLSLRDAAREAIRQELEAKVRATSIAIRAVTEIPETSSILVEVASLSNQNTSAQMVSALKLFRSNIAKKLPQASGESALRLETLCSELAVYIETLVEVRRVVGAMSTPSGWQRVNDAKLSDQVAGVRQALEVSVPLASSKLQLLRQAVSDVAGAAQKDIEDARSASV